MLAWFFSIGIIGLYNIFRWDPSVFKALNPWYGLNYFIRNKVDAWASLGGIVLCITGKLVQASLPQFSKLILQCSPSWLKSNDERLHSEKRV